VTLAPARSNVRLNEEDEVTIEPTATPATGGTADPAYFAARAAEQASAENFPVAMRMLPKAVREDLAVFYVFARYVDDIGDEYLGDRAAALTEIDADLGRLASGGTPKLEPVRGLGRITADGRVPFEPFHDLVAANLMDQYKTRYATFAELVSYCRLSANPVGRVVLHLAGQATEENIADSDAVCTGLQIVEHIQDVAEDYRGNNRVYLPREDLLAFGVREAELADRALRRGPQGAAALGGRPGRGDAQPGRAADPPAARLGQAGGDRLRGRRPGRADRAGQDRLRRAGGRPVHRPLRACCARPRRDRGPSGAPVSGPLNGA
jgi:squalene synthase HpnC